MPQLLKSLPTLYSAAILMVLVAVIVVSRRQPASIPSPRVAPELANDDIHLRKLPRQRAPRPLVITERCSRIPAADAVPNEVLAGFPEDEAADIGPVGEDEASIYSRGTELPIAPAASIPGMRRLAPAEDESASQPQSAISDFAAKAPAPKVTAGPQVPRAMDGETLRPVLQQASELNRQAESLARRGAFYLARNVTIQSLRMVAEALDLQSGTGEHTAALASALTALREAGDFQSRSSEDSTVSVPLVVAGHRTPVLRQQNALGISSVAAQQQYFNYARQQLVVAASGQAVASHSLCNLGKLEPRMAQGTAPQQTNFARAMVYQQAALAVDERNYPAANELGAILTSFGQLPDARRVLLHSVSTVSNPDGWQSLATVHDRLGETELAAQARQRLEMLTGGAGGPRPKIEWVSPDVFAGNQPAPPTRTTAVATNVKNDPRTADSRPKQKETWISPFGFKR